jgi:hypothetical protein
VLLLQDYVSLNQLKSQCRDAGDCHHCPRNYDLACAPASARQSLRMRSYRLFAICEASDDLSFHLVRCCNQVHALTRAWQNTRAMSSSATFGSPLSTPIRRKAERGVASPIDCHSDMSFLSEQDLFSSTGDLTPAQDQRSRMQGKIDMAKSSKLVAVKRGRILLVRRRRDRLWMFPGGQIHERESKKDCLRREIKEERASSFGNFTYAKRHYL